MRNRSAKGRIQELTRWLVKNRKTTWQEFVKETNGSRAQYYHIRAQLGFAKKNAVLSAAMKEAHKRKAAKAIAPELQKRWEENEEYLAGNTITVSAKEPEPVIDFVSTLQKEVESLQRKLDDVSSHLNNVIKVTKTRDDQIQKMMHEIIHENTELRVNNNGLRQHVASLTEMINGATV